MRSPVASSLALTLAAGLAAAAPGAQPEARGPAAWQGCCGLTPWPDPGAMPHPGGHGHSLLFGGYASIVAGSAVRHHSALAGEIPAPYANLSNPLPATPQNAQRGAAVYEADCASCHGATGLGDGPASGALTSARRPAHLGWITRLRKSRWDPFMYWSTVDGGGRFGTAMPSFKGKLTDAEIWSVIGYIQARLPTTAPAR